MAGRILPIALATVLGVSIGVATFDGEFKEQRRKRLQEEYDKELAAIAESNQQIADSGSSLSSASGHAQAKQYAKHEEERNSTPPSSTSSWSSMLGLWAWRKDAKQEAANANNERH